MPLTGSNRRSTDVKKLRVQVAPHQSEAQSFLLFNSAEALYVWLKDRSDDPGDYMSEAEEVIIVPGEYLEVEWRGCEFVYEGNDHQRMDFVRLAKASPSANASGMIISIHYGWTIDEELPISDYEDENIIIRRLDPDEKQLDLAILFKDDEADEEDE